MDGAGVLAGVTGFVGIAVVTAGTRITALTDGTWVAGKTEDTSPRDTTKGKSMACNKEILSKVIGDFSPRQNRR
jgi:hypothetical protein